MQNNLSDTIAMDIRNKILRQSYRPGMKLPNEFELAEQYSVCRYTIREAIKKLTAVGLISVKRGCGTFVNDSAVSSYFEPIIERMMLIDRNMKEIFEARLAIETKTASLAAERATVEELDCMHEIAKEMYATLDNQDLVRHNQLDIELHNCIAEASKNRLLMEMIHILSEMISYTLENVPMNQEKCTRSMDGHMKIIEAVEMHKPQEAMEEMEKHLSYCAGLIID